MSHAGPRQSQRGGLHSLIRTDNSVAAHSLRPFHLQQKPHARPQRQPSLSKSALPAADPARAPRGSSALRTARFTSMDVYTIPRADPAAGAQTPASADRSRCLPRNSRHRTRSVSRRRAPRCSLFPSAPLNVRPRHAGPIRRPPRSSSNFVKPPKKPPSTKTIRNPDSGVGEAKPKDNFVSLCAELLAAFTSGRSSGPQPRKPPAVL